VTNFARDGYINSCYSALPSTAGHGRIRDTSTQPLPGISSPGACRTIQPVSETRRREIDSNTNFR